jgi:hypothetical protein
LLADSHRGDGLVEALDDLAVADAENQRLAAVAGAVEFRAVEQVGIEMHGHLVIDGRAAAGPRGADDVAQAGGVDVRRLEIFAHHGGIGLAELRVFHGRAHVFVGGLAGVGPAEDAGARLPGDEGQHEAEDEEDAELTHGIISSRAGRARRR